MSEIASSSAGSPDIPNLDDESEEPPLKKVKSCETRDWNVDKLEQRLEHILCCVVCLDLPVCSMFQCMNGHLMCGGCLSHLLADARLRDEEAKCPTCRVEFSKQSASRNLAVERTLSQLPAACQFCSKDFPRVLIRKHEDEQCHLRITCCRYSRIGCPWRGPMHESSEHEGICQHPHRSAADVMQALDNVEEKTKEERLLFDLMFKLMSYEKIVFTDLQLRPYRTDEYVHKLFYETSRFSASFQQWVVKAKVNGTHSDPTLSSERTMTYQLCLKPSPKPNYPITVHFLVVEGPFGDMKVRPKIHKYEFTEGVHDSPYVELPLQDSAECNRLLAAKVINFRLIMFVVTR